MRLPQRVEAGLGAVVRDDQLRWRVLAGWSVVVFAVWVPLQQPISWRWFEQAARLLVGQGQAGEGTGGLHLYESHPEFQFGPITVVVTAILRVLGRDHAVTLARLLLAALALVVLWTLEAIARHELGPAHLPRIRQVTLLAGIVLIPAWDLVAIRTVHVDDAMALTLTVIALWTLRRAWRWWWPATLLGLAVAAKPWAIAFVPLLLLLPRCRARAVTVAVVLGAGGWVPFVVGAPGMIEALGNYRLPVSPRSALHLLGLDAAPVPAWLRPVQFVATTAAATAAVVRGRWEGAIFAAMATRILLDPAVHSYHVTGLVVGAVAWDLLRGRQPWPVWTVVGPAVILASKFVFLPVTVSGAMRLAISVAALGAVLVAPQAREGVAPPAGTTTRPAV